MRYEVMIQRFGRDPELIGAAEIAAPLGENTTVRGSFEPGPGYEGVRDIFAGRDGKRDLDAIERLAPHLYLDGLRMPSAQLDIADHREVIVRSGNGLVFEAPAVDSRSQLASAISLWPCATCGGPTYSYAVLDYAVTEMSRFVAATSIHCRRCVKVWWVMFPKSPRWTGV